MKNYNYVTTPPCVVCGETTQLTLDDESLARYNETTDQDYRHSVCPRDVVFVSDWRRHV